MVEDTGFGDVVVVVLGRIGKSSRGGEVQLTCLITRGRNCWRKYTIP